MLANGISDQSAGDYSGGDSRALPRAASEKRADSSTYNGTYSSAYRLLGRR
jgi:hypothetical protein